MPTATDPDTNTAPPPVLERLRAATDLLRSIAADGSVLAGVPRDDRRRLYEAVARVLSPDRVERRRMARVAARARKASRVRQDEAALHETGIRSLRRRPVYHSPRIFAPADFDPRDVHGDAAVRPESVEVQSCYVCKAKYTVIHHFYDQLCPPCAELTVTTRFPRDCAARYARETDFGEWAQRLEIVGLDLRHTPSVEAFCRGLMATRSRLDFIVNNACQTVRRPPGFYAHMMEGETAALRDMPGAVRKLLAAWADRPADATALTRAATLSQVPLLVDELVAQSGLFPSGQLDQDLQQVDLRGRNSWRLLLDEVSAVELLEVHLVNAVAPFILNARLKPLMLRTPGRDKHIVNVSAVEGQFYRSFKTTRHPHTNMAKAALNMMTRTAAADYHGDGIHMNSVDTGWVTDEDPIEIAQRKSFEHRFHPPLDIIDGAARIVDPIVDGINTGTHVWGQFLKDYKPAPW